MKVCRSCDVEKPLSDFYKKGTGRTAHCINCTKARVRSEEHKAYQRRYQKENTSTEQAMLNRSKSRARKKGFEHNITIEDIKIPKNCPLLGIPLTKGKDGVHSNSPTLDRIDSNKGYVKGNVWVISYKANTIKSDATPEELLTIATRLSQFIAERLQIFPASHLGTT
jgi:archaellum component FlaC